MGRNIRAGLYGIAVALALAGGARADAPGSLSCAAAGNQAEQAAAMPANILVSIGMVESGRADALTGQVTPWPWTVNVDGQGRYFDTKQDAIAFARLAESSGAQDVDVGCFQISLQNHPDAFESLDDAFDPAANAGYAAAFLAQLKATTGSWNTAIADYHSAVPDLGLPYQRRVLAAWRGLGNLPAGLADGEMLTLAPDLVVIKLAPAARLVKVYSMDDYFRIPARRGLPRVITP